LPAREPLAGNWVKRPLFLGLPWAVRAQRPFANWGTSGSCGEVRAHLPRECPQKGKGRPSGERVTSALDARRLQTSGHAACLQCSAAPALLWRRASAPQCCGGRHGHKRAPPDTSHEQANLKQQVAAAFLCATTTTVSSLLLMVLLPSLPSHLGLPLAHQHGANLPPKGHKRAATSGCCKSRLCLDPSTLARLDLAK